MHDYIREPEFREPVEKRRDGTLWLAAEADAWMRGYIERERRAGPRPRFADEGGRGPVSARVWPSVATICAFVALTGCSAPAVDVGDQGEGDALRFRAEGFRHGYRALPCGATAASVKRSFSDAAETRL